MRCQIAGEVRNFELPDRTSQRGKEDGPFYPLRDCRYPGSPSGCSIGDHRTLEEEVGISMGVGIGDLAHRKIHQNPPEQGPKRVSPFFIPMTLSNLAPGQVSCFFVQETIPPVQFRLCFLQSCDWNCNETYRTR